MRCLSFRGELCYRVQLYPWSCQVRLLDGMCVWVWMDWGQVWHGQEWMCHISLHRRPHRVHQHTWIVCMRLHNRVCDGRKRNMSRWAGMFLYPIAIMQPFIVYSLTLCTHVTITIRLHVESKNHNSAITNDHCFSADTSFGSVHQFTLTGFRFFRH